jgi:anaerobic selenocysteine-containing dehydrogenase
LSPVGDYSAIAIVAMKKVVEPVFEAGNDYDIFAEIAKRLGKERDAQDEFVLAAIAQNLRRFAALVARTPPAQALRIA